MLSFNNGGASIEGALVVAGLTVVQVLCAFFTVFAAGFLAAGLDPLFLVASGNLINSFLLLPLAFAFERKKWPEELGNYLIIRLVLIALAGTPMYQVFMLMGVKKTTPAVAAAIPNLAPGVIFIIASCLRLEKFNIKCNYTKAKIGGTLMCLGGAMALSFLQSPQEKPLTSTTFDSYNDWMIGCLYLLASVFALSCTMVLQALTMEDFPCPLSLCIIVSFTGSIFTGLAQFIIRGKITVGSSNIGITGLLAVVLTAGLVISVSLSIVAWSVHKRGPVIVSIFNPIQTICATVLSAIMLRQFIAPASLAGMAILFVGLYIVVWAKKKEAEGLGAGEDEKLLCLDNEKPLLC